MLLEAQLEKQLESVSFSQSCAEEVEKVMLDIRTHSTPKCRRLKNHRL